MLQQVQRKVQRTYKHISPWEKLKSFCLLHIHKHISPEMTCVFYAQDSLPSVFYNWQVKQLKDKWKAEITQMSGWGRQGTHNSFFIGQIHSLSQLFLTFPFSKRKEGLKRREGEKRASEGPWAHHHPSPAKCPLSKSFHVFATQFPDLYKSS